MAAKGHGTVSVASPWTEQPIRVAEVVGALSLATDLGTGQPLEHALRSAVLAVRLGELAGASAQELKDTYYVALLHASGCTSNGHEAIQVYDDDIAHRAFFLIDATNPAEVLAFYRANIGAGRAPGVRESMIAEAIANAGPRAREGFATMCEVAQRFAGWLALGPNVEAALEFVFARWDGRGFPSVSGDEIRCRCASCTWRGTSPSSSPRQAPTRHAASSNAARHCLRTAARRARRAALRRPPRRPGRDADVGAGTRRRAVSEDLDRR